MSAVSPRPVILDTDWWTDVDDVAAARVLVWAEREGLVEIAGLVLDAWMPDSVASLDAFFTAEGRPQLPIGVDYAATDFGGTPPYQTKMAAAQHSRSNLDALAATEFYRRILTAAQRKVDLICIGFGNALAALLASAPDEISPLTGLALTAEKVNRLWWMAGKWPVGSENNFARSDRARKSAHYIVDRWPTSITFLGYEVGDGVLTGGGLAESATTDLLAQALADHGSPGGRSSWDPMLTLLACIGDPARAGYDVVAGTADVDAVTGINSFAASPRGKHSYVRKLHPDNWYATAIDSILEQRTRKISGGGLDAVDK